MTLTAGSRLGPYEILSPLGAGGMGEVWRARDTKLGRDVALKVLPQAVAQDSERLARFEREAQVLASLNHPHVAAIYGVEDSTPTKALVLELVEGPTLQDRIAQGALPVEEAVAIARQIAEALEAAHEKGIVHRDLKPANVKLTPDGAVKVLDFGLAKALDPAGTSQAPTASPMNSPTLTAAGTQLGVILGTAAYMSPEQARGGAVDKRADIWAFGALLYEMLTAKRLFAGDTVSDTLAAVLRAEPDWSALPADIPPGVRKLLAHCLERDRKRRLRDMGDARLELDEPAAPMTPAAGLPVRRPLSVWRAAAAAVLVAALGGVAGWVLHPRPQPRQVLQANLALPEGFELALEDASLALSPDGRQLALIGARPGERRQIWVRSLERDDLHGLPGTNGASYPFWSPDGKWLGFFADLKLQKTPASGGAVQALCAVTEPRGASWSRSGTIVLAPSANGGLSRVAASGGDPAPVTQLGAGEYTHRMPWFLPDGRHVLFAVGGAGGGTEVDGIFALELDSGKTTKIMAAHSEGRYVAPGYLAFVRDGDLMLRPFDADSLQVSGEAVPIAAGVHFNRYRYTGLYTLADSGILIYDSSAIASPSQMTWFDLEGHELGKLGKPAQFQAVAIAPDGSRAATTVRDQNFEVWLYDLERGLGSKFTFGPAPAAFPVWSPDSHSLAWADGMGTIWSQPIDQSRPVATVLSEVGKIRAPLGWSPDGGTLLLVEQSPRGGDLLTLALAGKPEPRGLLTTAASETGGRLSPDGQWLLYVSNETGRDELFVTAYPGPGPKWQVSTGGSQSGWTQASGWWLDGGHRIAYLSQESKLFAVEVAVQGRQLAFGAAEPLFGGRPLLGGFDITPDSKRLLHLTPLEARTSLTLLSDWRSALPTP